MYEALGRIGIALSMPIDRSDLNLADVSQEDLQQGRFGLLIAWARQVGVYIKEVKVDLLDLWGSLEEGFPMILALEDGRLWICEVLHGKKMQASIISDRVESEVLSRGDISDILASPGTRVFLAKRELEMDDLLGGRHGHANSRHGHPTPLRRFLALLRLDARDIWTVTLFAFVAGLLALATPLAIESLVNVVSWGTTLQPLLILALMLLACLGLAGFLSILQTVVVEIIQRRQFVRFIGDLAHRFPRTDQRAFDGIYPRELANRLFDIVTIQKSTSALLLDGVSIVLTTLTGLLLLAFYHPFLLGFDIVLLATMLSLTRLLGRGGVSTAIDESLAKYRIVHWLQDVISMPSAFKVNGGEQLAVERANRLTTEYLAARERQFRVVIRQVAFAIGLQVVASTVLLGLGGWLVIKQQLTLGQLVASELVVTVVVSAFAKAGKSLEKFYDLMAGIEKVGHLIDLPVDPRFELGSVADGPAEVRWEDLVFQFAVGVECRIPAARMAPASRVAIIGSDRSGKSMLLKSLAGLVKPDHGIAEVAGLEMQRAALGGQGSIVAYAGPAEIFHSTIEENVDLGRRGIGEDRVREALLQVGLWDTILRLQAGTRTMLQTEGKPLSSTQRQQLILARAIAGKPRLLLIDGLLDDFSEEVLDHVWQSIASDQAPWTLLIATNREAVASRCGQLFELGSRNE